MSYNFRIFFKCMHKLSTSHRNDSSEAIIGGSVHQTGENILLLNNIDLSKDTSVLIQEIFWSILGI